MRLITRFFFIEVLMLQLVQVSLAQEKLTPLQWYESYINHQREESLDAELSAASGELLDAEEVRDYPSMAKLYKQLGMLHFTGTHDNEMAMDLLIKALAIEDSLDLKRDRVITYIAIAGVFEQVGDNEKCLQFLDQALSLNEQFADKNALVYVLNRQGKNNAYLDRPEAAFEKYELALHHLESLDQPALKAQVLFNVAHLFTDQNKYDDALEKHKEALALWRSARDKRSEALALNDIGELYELMNNNERAYANHVVALEIRKGLDDKSGIAESYNNLGQFYFNQKNYDRALANLELALQAGRESQTREQIYRSYEYLKDCYKVKGNYKEGLKYLELSLAMNEMIESEKNERKILETQSRYALTSRESQIDRLESIRLEREKQLEAQIQFRNFLFIIIGLVAVVMGLMVYLYIQKRKSARILQEAHARLNEQNVQLQSLNATKDKFFSIIGHDLKGPLNSLTSFSNLLINYFDNLSKEEIQTLARDLDKSLKNLFALLENLLEWARSQTGNIEFTPVEFDLKEMIEGNRDLLMGQAQSKGIELVSVATQSAPVLAHKASINTVVRNLISNAIKFTPDKGMVKVTIEKQDERMVVSVADTGVGMSYDVVKKLFRIDSKHSTLGTAQEKGTGLGLILCKDFVEKNGGKIWVESEPGQGSTFYFTVQASII